MIGQVPLEISAHVIGEPPPGFPAHWGPVRIPAALDGITSVSITASHTAMIYLRLTLDHWTELDDGWLSARARLEDVNLYTLGVRPALVYNRPHDIPTVTNFHVPSANLLFAVTMRRYDG